MFRKTTLLVAALALMVLAPQAQAAKGDWMIDFNGGIAMPMGDFKDAAKMGFMGGVGAGYMVTEAFCLGVDGSYIMNGGSDDLEAGLSALAGEPVDVKFSMINGGVHAKYMFPMSAESKVGPYVVAGAGMYNIKSKFESASASGDDSATKFGGRGGLGLMYKAGENVKVGVEGTYHFISTEGSSTSFVGVQAGVTIGMSNPK